MHEGRRRGHKQRRSMFDSSAMAGSDAATACGFNFLQTEGVTDLNAESRSARDEDCVQALGMREGGS
jgi:hypothetical protein